MGNFWHKEFLAPWTLKHGIFRHLNILAHGYFGTLQSNMDVLPQTFWHLCYCAEMSMCRNVPVSKFSCAENFLCRKFLVLKSPHVEMSATPNGALAEMFPWWNIRADMTFAEMFRAEMVVRHFFSCHISISGFSLSKLGNCNKISWGQNLILRSFR